MAKYRAPAKGTPEQRAQTKALADAAKVLKTTAEGKETLRKLRKELRTAATPMLKSVRAAALRLPSKGESARRGRPSLRKGLARATKIKISFSQRSAGVMVVTGPGAMPEGMEGLPPMVEGRVRWRHPVMGNRDVWVQQRAMPFFYPAVKPHEPEAVSAGRRVLEAIVKEIETE